MISLAPEAGMSSQVPPATCWIIRDPLRPASLRIREGILVFTTGDKARAYAEQVGLESYSVEDHLWNDLVEKGKSNYSSAVIDFDADEAVTAIPLEKVPGWPSTPVKPVTVYPPGTPLLLQTGTVKVPGYKKFRLLDCFPIVRKPQIQWLTDDRNEIQNHEWTGVTGKAFGQFQYQAWGTFRAQYMQGRGRVEKDVAPATLRIHELTREARLKEMASFLGKSPEMMMGQMMGLVCKQSKGEQGVLSTETQNIFLVRNGPEAEFCEGDLTAVKFYWDDSHGEPYRWCFDEVVIENVTKWGPGTRVFSM